MDSSWYAGGWDCLIDKIVDQTIFRLRADLNSQAASPLLRICGSDDRSIIVRYLPIQGWSIHKLAMGIFDGKLRRKALLVFSIAAGLVVPVIGHSQEPVIRFGIFEEGYPPYSIGASGDLRGIVGDTFLEIASAIGYQVEVVIHPEKRVRRDMKMGKIDAIANALEWESDTAGLVWTEGIIRVSDNVVMTADRQENIANLDKLKGKTVAIMDSYTYPSLEEMIESGELVSSRANRLESVLKMVEYKRVDYGIIDENVAKWVMRENNLKFDPPLYFATPGFDEVAFRIILRSQEWAPFVSKFNEALAEFESSGGLQKILNKYR